ncbi:MAG: ribulose-phosphate 3-epimerase [Chloroflexi bacterium]|nr:ribulose-phosphate 3-epimerase [Chloroflexota bacterium]
MTTTRQSAEAVLADQARVRISPSILSADFARLGEQVQAAEAAGADLIHVDVMDGHFVPNITIGPLVAEAVRRSTRLPMDVHLMIEQPERYIDAFAKVGADIIIVHSETCPHLERTLHQIEEAGALPAVTINPATPLSAIEEVLYLVRMILIMTVNPGFGGQKMIPAALSKVTRLKGLLAERGLDVPIEIDGGVNRGTLEQAVQAGANILVMGAALFAAPEGIATALQSYRAALENIKKQPA